MYVVNGSDGRCLVAVRLIVGVRYLERPLREVLLYSTHLLITTPISPTDRFHPLSTIVIHNTSVIDSVLKYYG